MNALYVPALGCFFGLVFPAWFFGRAMNLIPGLDTFSPAGACGLTVMFVASILAVVIGCIQGGKQATLAGLSVVLGLASLIMLLILTLVSVAAPSPS